MKVMWCSVWYVTGFLCHLYKNHQPNFLGVIFPGKKDEEDILIAKDDERKINRKGHYSIRLIGIDLEIWRMTQAHLYVILKKNFEWYVTILFQSIWHFVPGILNFCLHLSSGRKNSLTQPLMGLISSLIGYFNSSAIYISFSWFPYF